MTWTSGDKLQGGKYTIDKELGEGGFGITYLARNERGQRVVIKTLNDTVQRHPDFGKFQQDFLNEALRLARCSHPHIVRVEELIQEGSLSGMVMEDIDGEDLASRVINRGVLPEAEAVRYIQQIGEALTIVHNQGLLHRDVKPQNIMLRAGKSEAVLIDFGIAREFTPDLTQTHTNYTTDYFAPIEQYDRRAKRGAYTDVYALAATLYVILTGELPVPAPVRAANTPLESPKQLNRSISDKVNQAILKGMAFQAHERPQSMQEWLELLGLRNVSAASSNQRPSNKVSAPQKPEIQQQQVPVFLAVPSVRNVASIPERQTRNIPWGWLAGVIIIHAFSSFIIHAFSGLFGSPYFALTVASAFIASGVWAGLVTVFVALSKKKLNLLTLLVSSFAHLGAGFAGTLAVGWIIIIPFYRVMDKNLVLYLAMTLAAVLTEAPSWAKERQLNSLGNFHIFLILAGASWLGLGLGLLINPIFR